MCSTIIYTGTYYTSTTMYNYKNKPYKIIYRLLYKLEFSSFYVLRTF